MSMEVHIFCATSSPGVNTKYSCYFSSRWPVASAPCIWKSLIVILSNIRNQQAVFAGATLVGIWISYEPARCTWLLIVLCLIVLCSINSLPSNEERCAFATNFPCCCVDCFLSKIQQLCLPLSACQWTMQRTLSCPFFLAPWYEA